MATPPAQPPDPPRRNLLTDPLFLAYFDLYARYRGLLAVLAEHGIVPPERLEDDVEEWTRQRRRELLQEAAERFADYVMGMASDGPPPPTD